MASLTARRSHRRVPAWSGTGIRHNIVDLKTKNGRPAQFPGTGPGAWIERCGHAFDDDNLHVVSDQSVRENQSYRESDRTVTDRNCHVSLGPLLPGQ